MPRCSMARRLAAAPLAVLGVAASLFALATRANEATSVNPHREAARAILERHCGECHRADSPSAKSRALAVFNLNELDFAARMSPRQLRSAAMRLEGLGGVDARDQKTFAAFIA